MATIAMDAETWCLTRLVSSDVEDTSPAVASGVKTVLASIYDLELLVPAFDVGGAWAEAHDGGCNATAETMNVG